MNRLILLNEFINNVLCRRETNQEKASKIFKKLKKILTEKEIFDINDDWIHYTGGGSYITTEQFGQTIKDIRKKYE